VSIIYLLLVALRKFNPVSYFGIDSPYDTLIILGLIAFDFIVVILWMAGRNKRLEGKLVQHINPKDFEGLKWEDQLMKAARLVWNDCGELLFKVKPIGGTDKHYSITPRAGNYIEGRSKQ